VSPITLCLLVAWGVDPQAKSATEVYQFSPQLAAAIRAQDPGPMLMPPVGSAPLMNPGPSPAFASQSPVPGGGYDPFAPPPMSNDPFSMPMGSDPMLFQPPMPSTMQGPMYSGVNGPQPYRFGAIPRFDIAYIPQANISEAPGDVEMFEMGGEIRHNYPFSQNWVFTSAPQFDYRAWNFGGGLSDLGRVNLYRFGWDLQLSSPEDNGWSLQFTFNPSINTDMEHNLTSDAWNFDVNAVSYYRVNPHVMLAIGAGYLDRVDDIFIPYAGVVLNPNDRWEFRLLFPKAKISYFLGYFWKGHHWLYVSSEYHVEAFQIDTTPLGSSPRNRVQYEDWRLALGLRSDHGWFDKFIEVAWVPGRNFEFDRDLPKLDVSEQVMARFGIRF
jgi:hypothetical protein